MSSILSAVLWDVGPDIVSFGSITIRWYGLLFAMAFVVGFKIIENVYKNEGLTTQDADKVAMYMIFGVVIGARLGHVFFYQPDYYLANPIDIFKIWEGGLASHGASIGILVAMFFYTRTPNIKPKGYVWMLDRIILTVPLGGAFIRIGNLMNSEIYGKPTDVPWAFVYVRDPESGNIPRHPTQIYEAIGYILLYFLLIRIYNQKKADTPKGLLFGVFLIFLFGIRFFIEFLKENQVAFEDSLPLNMGQLLSIPFIIVGIIIYLRSKKSVI